MQYYEQTLQPEAWGCTSCPLKSVLLGAESRAEDSVREKPPARSPATEYVGRTPMHAHGLCGQFVQCLAIHGCGAWPEPLQREDKRVDGKLNRQLNTCRPLRARAQLDEILSIAKTILTKF